MEIEVPIIHLVMILLMMVFLFVVQIRSVDYMLI